jgi:hypothetical protein
VAGPDDVRLTALALPRAYEREVRGRSKFKVGPIVFTALSHDESSVGFGYPKVERDGLIASDPKTFFLPPPSDLRYQWVCAHLARLAAQEVREFVTDAWRMCTPRMLHELPDLPEPTARAWSLLEAGDVGAAGPLLHPDVHWVDGDVAVRGRVAVLRHLAARPRPRPPTSVEIRDGQVYRWSRVP